MSDSKVCVKFRVKAEVESGCGVYLVGSCPRLGLWQSADAVMMECTEEAENGYESLWETSVLLPQKTVVSYRFFIGKVMTSTLTDSNIDPVQFTAVMVWETNIQPRELTTSDAENLVLPLAKFGSYGGTHTVSRGWLQNETCVQVRFHNDPIFMWKSKYGSETFSIKCCPLNFDPLPLVDDSDEVSVEGPKQCSKTTLTYYNLNGGELTPSIQPATGSVYKQGDYLVFATRTMDPKNLGFQVEFYVHGISTEPTFVGSAYLLPQKQDLSLLTVRLPIIGLKHRPIGEVQVELFYITPLPKFSPKMDVSYQNHWKRRKGKATLNVGHRGMGSSYKRVTNVKENTIHSLHEAAQNGADFVELDVLLTKDHVPVIYHDFTICLSTPHKKSSNIHMVEVAVKDLTLDKLQSTKVYHSSSVDSGVDFMEITDGVSECAHQPFPTLGSCLEQVDPAVGFNIEVKYPQLLESGEHENDNYFDMNKFVDRILEVVLKHGADRKIILSTFHADCCVMLNAKQNKYPVLFLSNGPTERYLPYSDWRCISFERAISFAKAEGILGVNFQAEGLMKDLSLVSHVQSLGLVLFVWGEDLNEEHVKQTLRSLEVDAIIFDRIGLVHLHEHRESFFIPKPTPSLEVIAAQGNALSAQSAASDSKSSASV